MSNILELSHVEKIYGEKENQVKALKDICIFRLNCAFVPNQRINVLE